MVEIKSADDAKINGVEEQSTVPRIFVPAEEKDKDNKQDVYLETAHYSRSPYFFNYGKTQRGGEYPLAGAEFVIYKENKDERRLYLEDNSDTDTWYSWTFSEKPKTDTRLERFVSDDKGLVSTGSRVLPPGTYFFEEVKEVPGYDVADEVKTIKVEIPESWTDDDGNFSPVLVDGQEMDEMKDFEVTESVFARAEPKIVNMQRGRNRVKKFGFDSAGEYLTSLPERLKNGEAAADVATLAGGLAIIGFIMWRLKKRK